MLHLGPEHQADGCGLPIGGGQLLRDAGRGEGEIVERRSKKGRTFFGCERYPACEFVSWNKPVDRSCSKCGNPYLVESGRRGQDKCPNCGAVTERVADLAQVG